MSDAQQDLNETAGRQPAAEDQPSDAMDALAPPPASPQNPESENDESGRLSRLADATLATAKQAAEVTVSGSRRAAEATGAAAASAARVVGGSAKTAAEASASAAQAIGSGAARAGTTSGRAVASGTRWLFDSTSERTAQLYAAAQGLVASDLSPQLNDLVQAAVMGKATIFDKAMDAMFIDTGIGGSYHRLFDGGHTIFGAFRAAHGASPDDTLMQEALGAIQGLLRDVSTPRGLPLATWDKETFDAVAASLDSTFGIPKSWFYDLNTYDVGELLGGAVGAVSLIFGWNKAETESFASLATGMGMSAAVSANPLLLAVSVVAFGRAFHKANHADEYVELAEGGLKGAIGTGASMGTIALVGVAGGPVGVALLAGVTAGVLAHVATKDVKLNDLKVDLGDISRFVKEDAATVVRQVSQQAVAIGDAIGDVAADAGRAVTDGTASVGRIVAGSAAMAGKSVASSAAAVGRFSADQATTVGRGTADAAQAAGRLAADAAAATSTAAGSVARRAKELVDRDQSGNADIEQPGAADS